MAEWPRPPSRLDGIPETISPDNASLVEREPGRYCQVVFEPSFAAPHAVWFTTDAAGDAHVSVSVATHAGPLHYEALLGERAAVMLKSLCQAFLAAEPPACASFGRDGVYYHVAHSEGAGYATRSFWSPRHGSRDEKFVRVVEALRDYAVAPESLKDVYFWTIQRTVAELDCATDPKTGGCR